jgi:hypothetical protein
MKYFIAVVSEIVMMTARNPKNKDRPWYAGQGQSTYGIPSHVFLGHYPSKRVRRI